MNELILQGSRTLPTSDNDRVRISAASEALSVNSRRSYQGYGIGMGSGSPIRGLRLKIYPMR